MKRGLLSTLCIAVVPGCGVSKDEFAAQQRSEYRPVVPNDSASNRSQNRRIEIALTAADYRPLVVDISK